ncbi:MAG: hypothetical protein OCU12_05535 [Methanophagales archaeon]|nr:hypothetical protein [Methanophagales archaeon]
MSTFAEPAISENAIERGLKSYMNKIPYIRWGQAWMLRGLSFFGKRNE